MCGIAGMAGRCDKALLRRMCATIKHRGPDDEGYFTDAAAGVGLGMVRLSIIDLAGGKQPMASADGQLQLVFNGEIYNFRELRAELERDGVAFGTHSDTEVILALYERHGRDGVQRLRGMFAFAIWDTARRELFLARDRLGVKPLYYAQQGQRLYFASELKALLQVPELSRELDPLAVAQYFSFLYIPAPRSMLQAIQKLPAGTTATFARGQLALESYWDLARVVQRTPRRTPSVEELRAQLLEAVRLRLVSDVPLGVFLSGGLDSSTVVAAMRQLGADPIRTFALGFEPPYDAFNELPAARMMAAHCRTAHHELLVRPAVAELLPTIAWHLDEPCGDSSALLTYLVSRETRRHVTVALSGVGGDELFAGYPRYLGVKLAATYAHVPRPVRQALARCARWIPETTSSRNVSGWMRRFLRAGMLPLPEQYLQWTQFFDEDALQWLLTMWRTEVHAARAEAPHRQLFAALAAQEPLRQVLGVDVATYLSDNLLMFGDRMSMAHGLELREPLCDHRLLEYVASIPSALRLPGWQLKGWLKQAIAPWLPPAILQRHKQGFMLPLGAWLRGPLKPLVTDLLSPARLARRGWFDVRHVEQMLTEHLTGRRVHTHQLWSLVMFELWAHHVLERRHT